MRKRFLPVQTGKWKTYGEGEPCRKILFHAGNAVAGVGGGKGGAREHVTVAGSRKTALQTANLTSSQQSVDLIEEIVRVFQAPLLNHL